MEKAIVTVITPTYNRESLLEKLYQSLLRQTDDRFIWLVVDDGSEDNTISVVKRWQEDGKINIILLTKKNGGKHTALNLGIKQVTTPLTFIVDSDDRITPDAIEIICHDYLANDMTNICGLSYMRRSASGANLAGKNLPKPMLRENYVKCRYYRDIMGDMAEVWLTDCLKENPFPEFEGEKFMGEGAVWLAMAKKYDMIFFDKTIYICDYLEGGLTKNRKANNMKSPKGVMYLGEVHLDANLPLKYRIRAMMYYTVYGFAAGYNFAELFKRSRHKMLFLIFVIPGKILFKKWSK